MSTLTGFRLTPTALFANPDSLVCQHNVQAQDHVHCPGNLGCPCGRQGWQRCKTSTYETLKMPVKLMQAVLLASIAHQTAGWIPYKGSHHRG